MIRPDDLQSKYIISEELRQEVVSIILDEKQSNGFLFSSIGRIPMNFVDSDNPTYRNMAASQNFYEDGYSIRSDNIISVVRGLNSDMMSGAVFSFVKMLKELYGSLWLERLLELINQKIL